MPKICQKSSVGIAKNPAKTPKNLPKTCQKSMTKICDKNLFNNKLTKIN
jgi:hypothetical protein